MRRQRTILLGVYVLLLLALYLAGKPPLLGHYSYSGAVYDRNGTLLRLGRSGDGRYRLFVPLGGISPKMIETTLLYEDRYFRWLPGVNPMALAKAAVFTASGRGRRGASTITMQLARLRFGIDSSTIPGKIIQILRAIQLGFYYSKNEILEAYLNLAPYGSNIEGVGAAALVYFNKQAEHLSLAEALALAVMPQKPCERSPDQYGHEPAAMRAARERLAGHYLNEHPETDAAEAGLTGPLALRRRDEMPFLAPHISVRFSLQGKTIYTTLDLGIQQLVERRVRSFVARHQSQGIENAAVLLVDHRSMEVLASLGSVAFNNESIQGQVDGTISKRSPGSALKPFIYALALEKGLIHPRTILKDAPMHFGLYNPENFDGEYIGPLPASDALVRSRNVPAVFLETELRRLNEKKGGAHGGGLYDLLKEAGISGLRPPEHYGLALVLGGLEVTMEEITGLYAMLANYGKFVPLRYLKDSRPVPGKRLVSPEAAAMTLDILRADENLNERFSPAWIRDEYGVSWKTGTSYGFRDAWTIGVVGPFVMAVWVGNFDSRGNPIFIGRRAAAPLFFELLEALRPRLAAEAGVTREKPPTLNITEVEVCSVSGQIPTSFCPHTVKTSFIPGVSPIGSCDIHREVRIDIATGLRACPGETQGTRSKVYEFWPSDILRLFILAGMPRVQPPRFHPRCQLSDRAERGRPPIITSPQTEIIYNLRSTLVGRETIPMTATVDADVESLRWFVNERFVGTAKRGEPFFWTAIPGDYIVRVVDDNGRSHSQQLHVAVIE